MRSKITYIIALILLSVGILIFFTGFAINGFSFNGIGGINMSDFTEKSQNITVQVNSLNISDKNVKVNIKTSADGTFRINYFESDKVKYDINVTDNGTLNIIKDESYRWEWWGINFNVKSFVLDVYIPAGYNGEIDAKTTNSTINVSSITAAGIQLTSSNGKINITDTTVSGNVGLQTSNGKIEVMNNNFRGNLNAKTSNGKIEIERTDIEGRVYCDTSNGNINIDTMNANVVDVKTSNGAISLERITAGDDIIADTSNGAIKMDRIRFGKELRCTSSNGKIEGTIYGSLPDYSITSRTSNSSNSTLPSDYKGGDKQIYIKTSNANINISFLG